MNTLQTRTIATLQARIDTLLSRATASGVVSDMSAFIHNHTTSPAGLEPGDIILDLGEKVVASVERNMDNLSAFLIRFTDGSWHHAYRFSAFPIHRPGGYGPSGRLGSPHQPR